MGGGCRRVQRRHHGLPLLHTFRSLPEIGQIWFNGNCAFLLDSMIVDGMVEMNIPPTGIWSLQTARALRQLTGGVGVFTQSF